MADLQSLADGIALWRETLHDEATTAQADSDLQEAARLEREIARPVTKFDDDVLVFIGLQRKKKAGEKARTRKGDIADAAGQALDDAL